MKNINSNRSGKTSVHSLIRMAQINKYGFNGVLPEIFVPEAEIKKKIKKKKQNNKIPDKNS